jgi:hypothetical protein
MESSIKSDYNVEKPAKVGPLRRRATTARGGAVPGTIPYCRAFAGSLACASLSHSTCLRAHSLSLSLAIVARDRDRSIQTSYYYSR